MMEIALTILTYAVFSYQRTVTINDNKPITLPREGQLSSVICNPFSTLFLLIVLPFHTHNNPIQPPTMDALESTLRPLLTPITQNLPAPLPHLATQLLGPACYTSLVENISLSDTKCLKLAVSKGLGVGIIGASSIVKIPQLLKLLNSQSAAGISFLSYALETVSYLVTLVYNIRNGFPFSTFGETALIAVQNVAIAVLVLKYSGKGAAGIAFVAGLAALGWSLFNEGLVDMNKLQLAQGAAGVLGVASKLPQIATIYKEGSTGQLSAFAVSLRLYCFRAMEIDNARFSTFSRDRWRESSRHCRRWMIS